MLPLDETFNSQRNFNAHSLIIMEDMKLENESAIIMSQPHSPSGKHK